MCEYPYKRELNEAQVEIAGLERHNLNAAYRIKELEAEVRELTGLLKQAGAECQEWKDETARLRTKMTVFANPWHCWPSLETRAEVLRWVEREARDALAEKECQK